MEDRGRARIAEGHGVSGAQYLQRASAYYHVGERFLQPKSKAGNDAYMRGVAAFRDAAQYIKRPRLEHVEIPYGDTSLPAILVHAEPANKSGKVPGMVFFDGLDVTKEIQYFKGVKDLVERGIACLIVDGPGNGESIRFRDLYLRHDTEHYATPVFDWLAARPEIDAKRIGVMAISLGGYYAPRAAAYEQRFACCIAWGAQWDYRKIWRDRFERWRAPIPRHCPCASAHRLGAQCETQDEVLKLEPFNLDGAVQKITCPFLLLHGEGDEQIPMAKRRNASTRWARSRRRSRSSPARRAATTTARSTTRASLEPFNLDGAVQKITCPFLLLHGEGDEQIPMAEAQKCFDAVGAKQKTFKVFTREEGGYHHCQIDNQSICSAYMWDWLEDVLQPAR